MNGMAMSSSSMSMHMSSMTGSSSMPMSTGSSMSSSMDSMMDSMMEESSTGQMFMAMKAMAMTFFTATDTPLFSLQWSPATTGQYVGTCIFLIVLAFVFRFLIALRSNLRAVVEGYVARHDTEILRRSGSESTTADDGKQGKLPVVRKWRVNDALIWASIDTMIAGVGYLLMIAVMTMNVGYFMSVLGGTFLGSFIVGRWADTTSH